MIKIINTTRNSSESITMIDIKNHKRLDIIRVCNGDFGIFVYPLEKAKLEKDKSLSFVIDSNNLELYIAFWNLIQNVASIKEKFKKKEDIYLLSFGYKLSYHNNDYDINELYDEKKDQIKWVAEDREFLDSSDINFHKILYIKRKKGQIILNFQNHKLLEKQSQEEEWKDIALKSVRSARISMNGSYTTVFNFVFVAFFNQLKKVPSNITMEQFKEIHKHMLEGKEIDLEEETTPKQLTLI